MPIVKFVNEKKEIEVPEGANLRKEAQKAGVNIYSKGDGFMAAMKKNVLNCHGWGHCGTCRVKILKGMENTNPMGGWEKVRFTCFPDPAALAYVGNEDTMRLACCTKIKGDVEVETCPPLNWFGDNFFS